MATRFRDRRAQYFDADPAGALGLCRYRRSEREIAGLIGTETAHPSGFHIPKHAHDVPSLYVVVSGSVTEHVEGREHAIGGCGMVYTPAGEIHSNQFHQAGGCCFLVELTALWLERLLDTALCQSGTIVTRTGDAGPLALRLHREFSDADDMTALAAEGLMLEILASLCRASAQASHGQPRWLRVVRDMLHARMTDTITIAALAAEVGVHPVHLARTFRQRYGCTPGEYKRRVRVEHATRLLLTTRQPLADIALGAGFADQAHFSRVFKHHTGLTPARFRATFAAR